MTLPLGLVTHLGHFGVLVAMATEIVVAVVKVVALVVEIVVAEVAALVETAAIIR